MKPQLLKIKNVRSYKEAILDYENAKLIYYYGLNGSGKTTIARALLFLIGMEPEDGDIRMGEDLLEVEGIFDVSDVSSSLVPRSDILHVYLEKQIGKRVHYRIGEERKRISHARLSEYFSSIGASPTQVFIQMGSIPLPFRSAVEEHIKKRGLAEHRRRRFSALMDLMGIRDFIGVLEEKKLDYDRVMEIYKEAKLDLIDVTRNFELVKTQYERFLEYKAVQEEIEKLKKLRKVVQAAQLLTELRELARKYGELCRHRKTLLEELEEKRNLLKDIEKMEHRLSDDYKKLTKAIETFEVKKNRILADIGKVEGQLKSLGDVKEPHSDRYMMLTIPQLESVIAKIDSEIKALIRKKNALKSKQETMKGQRESIARLLEDRKKELEDLLKNIPEPVDEVYLGGLADEISTLKRHIRDIKERQRRWKEKLSKSPVIVKDARYADIVAKVLAVFLEKDLAPLGKPAPLPYPSLQDYIETNDETLRRLLSRIFIVPDKESADEVRSAGALAIIHEEMWDWWGIWEEKQGNFHLAISSEQVEDVQTDELEEKLQHLEEEYKKLQKAHKAYLRHQDRIRFVKTDIQSLEQKLSTMPDVSRILEEIREIDRQIESLKDDKQLAEDTLRYQRYLSLTTRRDRLYRQLEEIKGDAPDKKKIEDIVARLSSATTDKNYLEKDISKLRSLVSKEKREMLSLKDKMLSLSAKLSVYDKDLLADASLYQGDMSTLSIDRQIALLEAKLQGMGQVEDVTLRYEEMKQTVENMKRRFEEVEKWQAEALGDLMQLKQNLINSIRQIQSQITDIFSDFLSTFGFDGKIEIHIDTDAPKTVGDVVVSIRSRDGVWNDYDVMRLSGGEGILVAFSLYLAAWMVKTGNVHFLMIDEAQTNLDKVNFGKLLRLLLEKVPGQIHVFTMVEPPKVVADRDDTLIYHITRNVFNMASEVIKVE
ncbi:MAG: AAA family ATPase [Dictyoglomi bacterium]|nr:AAA family ATPase [Dictyoglomota bacterium]